jgi:hypothetical protein
MKPHVSSRAPALVAVVFLFLSPAPVRANEKRPSLPASVLSARTVYVDNQTASAELQNTAYMELSKWGRFQIVDEPQKAQMVLRLSNGNYVKFVPGGEKAPAQGPTVEKQNWMGADEAVPPGSTRISVIDPKSGTSLWSDIRKTDSPQAASHMLDGLRAALDQKQK